MVRVKDSKGREILLKIIYTGELPVDSSVTTFVLPVCKLANKYQRWKGVLSRV